MFMLNVNKVYLFFKFFSIEPMSSFLIIYSIEGGELFERVIDDDFVLTEKACTIFMRQICEGVEYIHSQNILHLDMKVRIMFIKTEPAQSYVSE